MKKNIEESIRAGTHPKVLVEAGYCYANAFRAMLNVPEYHDADYVEGWAVYDGGFCMEHGWVEKDGEIIDPTWPDRDVTYFPGLRFHGWNNLLDAMKNLPGKTRKEHLPLHWRHGWGGCDSPEFSAAFQLATAHAQSLIASNEED